MSVKDFQPEPHTSQRRQIVSTYGGAPLQSPPMARPRQSDFVRAKPSLSAQNSRSLNSPAFEASSSSLPSPPSHAKRLSALPLASNPRTTNITRHTTAAFTPPSPDQLRVVVRDRILTDPIAYNPETIEATLSRLESIYQQLLQVAETQQATILKLKEELA